MEATYTIDRVNFGKGHEGNGNVNRGRKDDYGRDIVRDE